MRLLELFSGTGSVGAAFRRAGWDVTSVDLDAAASPDIVADVGTWDYRAYPPGYWDHVHASPPCTHYSRARTNAKTPRDLDGADALVRRALEIIFYFQPTCWTMENPWTGLLPSRPFMEPFGPMLRVVTCCKYGLPYKKATAIWSNLLLWKPRPACSPYMPCAHFDGRRHPQTAQRAPGKVGGVRRSGDSFGLNELYRMPAELCDELAAASTRQVQARADVPDDGLVGEALSVAEFHM